MKNLSKISLLFIFLSLLISTGAYAATTTATATSTSSKDTKTESFQPILLATVNIQNVKIISQEGNVFKISFSISNREILQTGVRYGVQLIKENNTNKSIIDEYTYDESLTLSENTNINKEITYTAPAGLNGDYFLRLVSKNSNGFPFAFGNTKAVTLISSVKGVSILTDSCTLSLNDKDVSQFITTGISLNSTDKLNLTCEGINSSNIDIEVTPSFDTRYISAFGEVVTVPASTPITFKKLEKKNFSVLIPVASLKPQSYNTSMYLKSGDITSNKIFINYSINGAVATLSNLSLDKESYVKGDTANVSIYGLFSNGPLIKNDKGEVTSPSEMTLTANINNGSNIKCSALEESKISPIDRPDRLNIPIKITRDCINPQVSVTVKDDKGMILTEQTFSFDTGVVKNNNISKWLVISIVVLILIILVIYMYLKKKKEEKGDINGQNSDQNTPVVPIASLFLFIALFSIFGFTSAKVASADTIALFDGSTATYSLYTMPGIGISGIESDNYKANEKFQASVEISSYMGANSSTTTLINDSNATPQCSTYAIPSGNCTDWWDDSWVITAPSTSGDYNVNFTFKTSCNIGNRFNYSNKCTDPRDSILPDARNTTIKKVFAIDSDGPSTTSKVVYKNYYNSTLKATTKGDLFTLSMCGITNGIQAGSSTTPASSGNAIISTYENRLNSASSVNPWASCRSSYTAKGAYNGGLYELTIDIIDINKIPTPPTLTVVSQDSGLTATTKASAPYTVVSPPTGTWSYPTSCPTDCGTAQSTQTETCTGGNGICSGTAETRTCDAIVACVTPTTPATPTGTLSARLYVTPTCIIQQGESACSVYVTWDALVPENERSTTRTYFRIIRDNTDNTFFKDSQNLSITSAVDSAAEGNHVGESVNYGVSNFKIYYKDRLLSFQGNDADYSFLSLNTTGDNSKLLLTTTTNVTTTATCVTGTAWDTVSKKCVTPSTKPLTPTNFQVSASSLCDKTWLNLSWDETANAPDYDIVRTGTPSGNISARNVPSYSCSAGTCSMSDTGLTIGNTYSYTIQARNPIGSSPSSSPAVSAKVLACPKKYTVTVSANAGGKVDQLGANKVDAGGTLKITYSLDTGFEVGSIIIDGKPLDAFPYPTVSVTNINKDQTVVFDFTEKNLSVNLSANPTSMVLPTNSTTLKWVTTGSPESCIATGDWTGTPTDAKGGTDLRTGMVVGEYTFVITCKKMGMYNYIYAKDTQKVQVSTIGVNLSINGNNTITLPENSSTLQWTTSGSPTSCTASGGSAGWSGPKNPTSYGPPHTETMSNLTGGVYIYNIKCIKGTEEATSSITLTVIDPNASNPIGALSGTDCKIDAGESTCVSKVTWTTSNLIRGKATAVTKDNPVPNTLVSTATSGMDVPNIINHGDSTFYLYHNVIIGNEPPLATKLVTASCDATKNLVWDPVSKTCITPTSPIGTWEWPTECPTACGITSTSTQKQICNGTCSGIAEIRTCNKTEQCPPVTCLPSQKLNPVTNKCVNKIGYQEN